MDRVDPPTSGRFRGEGHVEVRRRIGVVAIQRTSRHADPAAEPSQRGIAEVPASRARHWCRARAAARGRPTLVEGSSVSSNAATPSRSSGNADLRRTALVNIIDGFSADSAALFDGRLPGSSTPTAVTRDLRPRPLCAVSAASRATHTDKSPCQPSTSSCATAVRPRPRSRSRRRCKTARSAAASARASTRRRRRSRTRRCARSPRCA